jgi:hypothetical protein
LRLFAAIPFVGVAALSCWDGVVEADREQHGAFLFLLAGQRRFDFVLAPLPSTVVSFPPVVMLSEPKP